MSRPILRLAWCFDAIAQHADRIAQGLARLAGEADASSDRGGVFLLRECSECNGAGRQWYGGAGGDVDLCWACGGPGVDYVSIGEALEELARRRVVG